QRGIRGAGDARWAQAATEPPPEPTQLPAKKRILCDRHHIASAMAELVSYLSIVPHMRSVRRSSEILSPAYAGLFSAPCDFLVEAAWGEVFDMVTDCVAAN